jgi:hypothetical protein
MTIATHLVAALLSEHARTSRSLAIATGYADTTIRTAVSALQKQGKVTKQGRIYRGAGRGSGAPQAIYAWVQG